MVSRKLFVGIFRSGSLIRCRRTWRRGGRGGASDKKIVHSAPVDYQPLTKVTYFQTASSATDFPLQFGAIFCITKRRAGTYRQHVPPLDKTHRVEKQILSDAPSLWRKRITNQPAEPLFNKDNYVPPRILAERYGPLSPPRRFGFPILLRRSGDTAHYHSHPVVRGTACC